MKRERGFTLIELIVVVGLIAVMAAIAVPSFRSFIANYRTTNAANDFLQGVTLTRSEALKAGKRVVMVANDATGCPSSTGSWIYGWTIFADTNRNLTYQGPVLYRQDAPSTACGSSGTADVFIARHVALPSTIATTNANGSGQAFTDTAINATYIAFDGTGYPRLSSGATAVGGIQINDTTANQPNWRTMCLALLGRPRIVQGQVACTSG